MSKRPEPDGYINYVKGANVAGFMKVAKAMMAQGLYACQHAAEQVRHG